ncbi:MAG TPA: putative 2OG-Fe(II) oxygenase [Caulobacteraceae bacterium]|jgi:tetratricopeptide (TPR) repeat protein
MERVLEPPASERASPTTRAPIAWAPFADGAAAPDVELSLLERAFRARPANPQLATAYGRALVDRMAFDAAMAPLAAAAAAAPDAPLPRARLAECQVRRDDFTGALASLAFDDAAAPAAVRAQVGYLRGSAHASLGETAAAEAALRSALAIRPAHSPTFRKLASLLADAGRDVDLIALCDGLAAQDVRHSRLLSVRAQSLAALGRAAEAAELLDMSRVDIGLVDVPAGFASLTELNAALAEELLDHPYAVKRDGDRVYAGGRVHHLLHGPRPQLIRALAEVVRPRMETYVAGLTPRGDGDLWARARPAKARLDVWGVVQHDADRVGWHIHPNAWLSGVYYVAAPPTVSAEGEGPGCLEFGPPPEAAAALAGFVSVRRIAPEPGLLVLAPGHFHHRTIATGAAAPRISIAFDLAPIRGDDEGGAAEA